ncbi:transmembrane protein 183-like isoform X1 [Glandiceps talaboti]
MPKRSRRGKGRGNGRNRIESNQSDVTVNDYANADGVKAKTGRQSKATTNAMMREVKNLCGAMATRRDGVTMENDDLAWYDKDFSDDDVLHEEESDTDVVVMDKTQKTGRQKKKKSIEDPKRFNEGRDYPLDLWYILSHYVHPDDVGRFSAICLSAFYMTNTVHFWLKLYRRYYNSDVELPVSLQPDSIEKSLKLRCNVIRAIYLMYTPFQKRIKNTLPLESETPHCLENAQCLYMWTEKHPRGPWNFYFKFRMPKLSHQRTNLSVIPYDEDIWLNPENQCCVLSITCMNFIRVPVVMGMILTKVYLYVSRDMKHFNLKLVFHTANKTGSYHSNNGVIVTLDPVSNARILNWWHPHYPGNK